MTAPIPFDPTFKERPLSWSQLSAFEWNKEEWYDRYILRIKPEQTPAMLFGEKVDKKLQTDPTWMPQIPRHKYLQHKVNFKFGKIHLVAIFDSYKPPKNPIIDDYKTGGRAWTQERADETGQLTLYAFSLWQNEKIRPEDVTLGIHWIPTKENGDFSVSIDRSRPVQHFVTYRTMKDVLKFGQYINATVKEMEKYVKARQLQSAGELYPHAVN